MKHTPLHPYYTIIVVFFSVALASQLLAQELILQQILLIISPDFPQGS